MDKKILQKTYPFLQYFLVQVTGFPPVAALADKQSTGLFGPSDKLLKQFSPYFKSHRLYKAKKQSPKDSTFLLGAGDGI